MRRKNETARGGSAPRRRSRRRFARRIAGVFAFLAFASAAGAVAVAWMLARGPVESVFLAGRIASALETRIGDGFRVEIRQVRLSRGPEGLAVEGDGVSVRDPAGKLVVEAPRAAVSFDGASLFRLAVVPREVELIGLSVALTLLPDGTVSVSTAGPPAARVAPKEETPAPADAAPLRFASFVDAVASPQGALAILERVGLRDGTLVIDDRRNGRTATYSDLSLVYSRPGPGETRLAMRARGAQGRWGVSAVLRGLPGETRTLEAGVQDLAVSEVLGFAEKGSLPVHTDMPLSFDVSARLGADDRLEALEGVITAGSAQILFDDPHFEPIAVERLGGRFALTPDGGRIELRDLDVAGAGLKLRGGGSVEIPQTASAGWRFSFSAEGAVGRVDPQKPMLRLDSAEAQGVVSSGFEGIRMDRLALRGPEIDITAAASLGRAAGRTGLSLDLNTGRMPIDAIFAFWPSFSAPDTRRYFITHVDAGTVERLVYHVDFTPEVLADAFAGRPVPDGTILLELRVSGGVLRPAPGLPALTDLAADGVVTGTTAAVKIHRAGARTGAGAPIVLSDGRFHVGDTTRHATPAAIAFRMRGGADSFVALLQQDAVKAFAGGILPDPAGVRGLVDARVEIDIPLEESPPADRVKVTVQGAFSNLAADKAVGQERLEAQTLNFSHTGGRLAVRGEGRIGGVPASFDYVRRAGSAEPEYTVLLTVDDAVRTRRGLKTTGLISGPVLIRASSRDGGGTGHVSVEVDFAKAAIAGLLPTWSKPAGRPAKAVMRVKPAADDRFEVLDLVLDGGNGLTLRGAGEVASDGTILQASLSQLRLSPGDEMKVDIERAGGGSKFTIRAASLDVRPFLKSVLGPSSGGDGDLDIDLKAAALQGFGGEVLANAELRLVTRSREVREFRLSGRLGRAAVSGQTARSETGAPALVVESADAGGFLRFIDLYRRMTGGALLMQLSTVSDPLAGFIVVQNFSLTNDPALSGVAAGSENRAGRTLIEDASVVSFTKLRAEFERAGNGVLTLKDGVMWGPALGGTLEGTVDMTRDRVDLTGTFVPAYALNNIPNKVPFFGSLLFGGPNEGVFAVNFRISGSQANPAVTFNPLSAVAPGFLRKLFGVAKPNEAPVPPRIIP